MLLLTCDPNCGIFGDLEILCGGHACPLLKSMATAMSWCDWRLIVIALRLNTCVLVIYRDCKLPIVGSPRTFFAMLRAGIAAGARVVTRECRRLLLPFAFFCALIATTLPALPRLTLCAAACMPAITLHHLTEITTCGVLTLLVPEGACL